jgi:nitroreductase
MAVERTASGGVAPKAVGGAADDLERLLAARHSTRAFLPDPLPDKVLKRLFALAQRSASWCNTQPWSVHVTSGNATEAFADALTAHVRAFARAPDLVPPADYRGVYRERRRAAGHALYNALAIARDDQPARQAQAVRNYRFFDAPHVAVVSIDRWHEEYGAVDCGGYVMVLLLAAQALGVGAVAQASIAMYADFVRSYFGLGPDRRVVCAVALGYEDAAHPANSFRVSRADVTEAVTWVD